jgi:hypothetical protein
MTEDEIACKTLAEELSKTLRGVDGPTAIGAVVYLLAMVALRAPDPEASVEKAGKEASRLVADFLRRKRQ